MDLVAPTFVAYAGVVYASFVHSIPDLQNLLENADKVQGIRHWLGEDAVGSKYRIVENSVQQAHFKPMLTQHITELKDVHAFDSRASYILKPLH